MPIRICSVSDFSRPVRGRRSIVTQLAEYLDLKTKLSNGLKPNEGVEITLSPSSEKGHKSILQTFKRQVQKDLAKLKLNDYEVSAFKNDSGQNVITVANLPPIHTMKHREQSSERGRRAAA